jgi:hypothetical protein
MKKSIVYRTLQVASAVGIYSMISIWASAKHMDAVSAILTQIDSLLVILAIAVALPYFCFKVLGKLYTPPPSRDLDNSPKADNSAPSQEVANAIGEKDLETMLYRGTRYKPEDFKITIDSKEENRVKPQPTIKYRGASIADDADNSSQDAADSFSTEKSSQKSAKPKERMKYRGSYID